MEKMKLIIVHYGRKPLAKINLCMRENKMSHTNDYVITNFINISH